jgi:hypothetical protein
MAETEIVGRSSERIMVGIAVLFIVVILIVYGLVNGWFGDNPKPNRTVPTENEAAMAVEQCPAGSDEVVMSHPLNVNGGPPWTAYVEYPGKAAHNEVIVASDVSVDAVMPNVVVCVQLESNVKPLRIVAIKQIPKPVRDDSEGGAR